MRRVTALCAASAIALSAIATVTPAQAAFQVIKWSGNDLCQVWDQSLPTKPWPANYTAVSKHVASFETAIAVKNGLMKKGVCKF
jgi:tRNA U34 5-carboxymethylaminomethyl modifying GTPase MnmE/TrmE